MALGIRTVYQELSLLPHLSVAENVLLGRMPARGLPFVIDWREANRHRRAGAGRFRLSRHRPAPRRSGSLSVARQQIVEIAKALVTEPRILILDEPTAVLSAVGDRRCSSPRCSSLAAAGATVLYISHRLEEIFEIADEIVVLKDGASVLAAPVAELDQDRHHPRHGRPAAVGDLPRARRARPAGVVLEVERLGRAGASRT